MMFKEIGAAIRRARESTDPKMTQKQLAAKIGKTESSIAKYEQGLVEIPLSVVVKIADVLGKKPVDLLGDICDPREYGATRRRGSRAQGGVTMAEYVEREDVLTKKVEVPLFGRMVEMVAVSEIQRIPAADVRPVVRGRWADSKLDGVPSHCSECNYSIDRFYKTRFCPNCGADMGEWET